MWNASAAGAQNPPSIGSAEESLDRLREMLYIISHRHKHGGRPKMTTDWTRNLADTTPDPRCGNCDIELDHEEAAFGECSSCQDL